MRFMSLCACAMLSIAGPAAADIITVDDDRADLPTADFTAIQAALNAAVNGDEIVVYPGIYGTPDFGLDMRGLQVPLRSTDPDDPLVVDATRIEPSRFQAVRFNDSDTADDLGLLNPDGQVSFGDFLALLGLVGPCI